MRCVSGRHRRPLWSLVVIAAVLLFLWSGAAATSERHAVAYGEGRLWRVERGDAPPSHVMGTIHVADPRVRDLPASIREAFEASEQAAFELIFTPQERDFMAEESAAAAEARPARTSLAKTLDKETYDRVLKVAARYGLPAEAIDCMPPGALAFLFQTPPEEMRRRAEGDLFFDLWLIQWAYDLGLRVIALETPEEQSALLEERSSQDQAAILREVLDRLENDPNPLEELITDYLAGSMTATYRRLAQAARDGDSGARRFKAVFLDARNQIMVERMIPLLERGKAFVAVGALHIPGEQGILALLKQRGYRITRVY